MPSAQARALSNFARLQDGGKPTGTNIGGHQGNNPLFFAPRGMTFYLLPTQDVAHTGGGSFTGMSTAKLSVKEQG